MNTFKKLMIFMLAGALIGDIAAMLVSPAMLAWYETPGDNGALCNCIVTVRSTAAHFIRAQAIGAAAGAALFLIVGILFLRARAHRRAGSPPSSQSISPTGEGSPH